MSRTSKWILMIAAVIMLIAAGVFVFFTLNKSDNAVEANLPLVYDTDAEVSEALLRLNDAEQSASIIQGANAVENVAALTFEGTLDKETAEKILDLLEKYKIQAAFFFPGIAAAEDPDTIKSVEQAKHAIGSYTLSARPKMELYESEALVEDFTRSSMILKQITGTAPDMLKCNQTEYTGKLLKAAYASGMSYAIQSDYYLNYQSFPTEKSAAEFVKGLRMGSVLSIKTDGALDESEFDKGKVITQETPAIDPRPSLKTEKVEESALPRSLVTAVEYLLKALKEQGYTLVPLKSLVSYDDSYLTNFTAERAQNNGKLAKVYGNISTSESAVAYSFRGIQNEEMLNKVLKVLKKNNDKATFFVTGSDILQYPDRIRKILSEGHTVGNGGMTGAVMETMSFREACYEIYQCDKMLKDDFQVYTTLFMPVYGKYSDIVREAASTLNYSLVTYSKMPVADDKITVDEFIKNFNVNLRSGDILFFRLDYHDKLDEIIGPISNKIKKIGKKIVSVNTLLNTVTFYPVSSKPSYDNPYNLKYDKTPSNYTELLAQNASKKALHIKNIYTTQATVAYVFRNISDKEALDGVLGVLDTLGVKGTFFVTGKEILRYPENLEAILAHGHQVCNGGYAEDAVNPINMSLKDMCYEIDMGERILQAYLGERYDPAVNKYYMPLYADTNAELLEAASAMGYQNVITYNKNPAISSYKDLTAEAILSKYFANTLSLHRGDVVFFKIGVLSQSNAMSELIYEVANQYIKTVPYEIATVGNMLQSPLVYTPLTRAQAAAISPIAASDQYSEAKLHEQIIASYIGTPSKKTTETLVGFTQEEIEKINSTGTIDTKGEKVIFLTFDDWGSDPNITKLLNVLHKYNAEATFFVRVGTDKMPYDADFLNPNLLRAVALEGHDVASHTFSHMTIDMSDAVLQSKLQEDILVAYDEILRYTSDTGSLQLFFRPPTLAVSRMGMETIFSSGHTYIVNGDFSTHDYEAKSPQSLIDKLEKGLDVLSDEAVTLNTLPTNMRKITSGSIVVMHMSDEAQYTAEALDTVIPYYMAQGYRFEKLSAYLKNGYKNSAPIVTP